MKKKNQTAAPVFYETAPDKLLDCICDVNALLEKVKAKSGENESYKFWKHVSNVMKFSWDYMIELKWILDRSKLNQDENIFLRDRVRELSARLQFYENIRELKLDGRFEEVVKHVDAMMDEFGPELIKKLIEKKENVG